MAIKITKLRIINWHFMTDSGILPFMERVFLTGKNASGKSTIIDALITLLFVCRSGYNKANDISSGRGDGRTLMGYIRGARNGAKGEDGSEDSTKAYVRQGNTVTHIAAELFDSKKNIYYTLGVTFEVAGNRTESSAIDGKWWLAENVHLEEIPLTIVNAEGKKVVQSLEQFKSKLPEEWLDTLEPRFVVYPKDMDAKMKLSILLGISSSKHGSKDDMEFWKKTMMRCIAFRPDSKEMKNSDAFVRNVVLEANDVDETDLEDLLDQLRNACNDLATIQERQRALKHILELGEEYGTLAKHHRLLGNTVCLVRMLTQEERVAALDAECEILAAEHKGKEEILQKVQAELQTLRDERKELELDPTIKETAPLRREIEEKEKDIKVCEGAEAQLLNNLAKVKDVAAKVNHVFGAKVLDDNRVERALAGELLDLSELQQLITKLESAREKVVEALSDMNRKKEQVDIRIRELREEIDILRKGSVRPLPYARKLKDVIAHEFRIKDILDEPKYLYELLDFKDNSWAKATEAHMGQKVLFSIVVAPENYKCAAKAFRDCPDKNDVAGAILVDTKAFATEEVEVVDGSLAANLVTGNPFVRQYINYRYNQVMLVDDAVEQEDNRGTYLDMNGMRYSGYNLTRLVLPEHTLIGEEARRERLFYVETELARFEQQGEELRKENQIARLANDSFESKEIINLRASATVDQLRWTRQLPEMRADLASKQARYREMTNSAPFHRLNQIDKDIQKKDTEVQEASTAERSVYTARAKKESAHKDAVIEMIEAEDKFNLLERNEPDAILAAKEYLEFQKSKYPKRYLPRHEEEMCSEMKDTQDKMADLNVSILVEQKEYNRALDAGLPCMGHESLSDFKEAYDRINSEELPIAYRNSELYNKQMTELLQTRLIKHLKTAIGSANNTLRVLNKTLENMIYNGNYYQFAKIKPAKGREKYFDVIMHADSMVGAMQNLNLFATMRTEDEFQEEEQAIRELVENIRNQKSDKGENWLDYRTYCEFAIDVVSAANPDCRNKLDHTVSTFSGAEVQIPFYTVLTASLVNRYAQGVSLTAETIKSSNALRLMIVDECFSKMDTGNTQQLVEFICRDMGMQLIAAAPPGTFTALAGAVNDIIYMKGEQREGKAYRRCFPFTADEFLAEENYEETQEETWDDQEAE